MAKSWINKDLFSKFQEEKKQEKEKKSEVSFIRRSEISWKNPTRGTSDKAKVYTGRFLPDPNGNFYKKYMYHMFQTGDNWSFFLCPKTHNFDNYCPWCSVTSKLYTGTKEDKKAAYNYKRKEKFVSNFYVLSDPRDAEADKDEEKAAGKVKIYEFPSKVEAKLKEQITDSQNGLGPAIFDPGKGGFDFILKVLSTKKDEKGKEWPDYSLSDFSRKAYALGTDEEIEKIMDQTVDIDEYIQGMARDEEETIAALKQHMVYDLVSNEMSKNKTANKTEEDVPPFDVDEKKETTKSEPSKDEDEDISDEELLRDLENL